MPSPLVLVHGGAGLYADDRVEPARHGCRLAADAGAAVLERGGSALDAVCEAVRVLEDDPEFNAGTGSCLTADGTVEMDACVMEGAHLLSGAVAALTGVRNPVLGARRVMEQSRHVLLAGEGARRFLLANGIEPWPEEQLVTERAREKWRAQAPEGKHGTVGAVARDAGGHLAAATSTGGILRKLPGRVGDSPIPGAGTFADDARAAASATGTGEPILRLGLTRTAADLVRALGPQAAVEEALRQLRERTGGEAGLILLAADGEPGIARTTRRMSWAWRALDGRGDARCE
jgi:beta-aspartyl-peptidase (threonine type)